MYADNAELEDYVEPMTGSAIKVSTITIGHRIKRINRR